jgi:hydrogenase-4 membrane subunit HyfE
VKEFLIYVFVLLVAFGAPTLISVGVMLDNGWLVMAAALLAASAMIYGMARVSRED